MLTQESDVDLFATEAQNPRSDNVRLPIKSDFNFGFGHENDLQYVLSFEPTTTQIPVIAGWTATGGLSVPVIDQPEIVAGFGEETGLGDISGSFLLGPPPTAVESVAGSILAWQLGPTLALPTAGDDALGFGRWRAGPAALLVWTKPGAWLASLVVVNQWSFAGQEERDDVRLFVAQPTLNYVLQDGWKLVSSPVITASWDAPSDQRWNVPLGGGVGKVFDAFGVKLDVTLEAFGAVEHPSVLADWSLRFAIQPILSVD